MLHDLRVSADALQRVADWMLSTGAGGADVELRRDGDVLVAEQGDDRAAWNMAGIARPDIARYAPHTSPYARPSDEPDLHGISTPNARR